MTVMEQKPAPTLQVDSILYQNEPARIRKTISHLNRAADLAIASGALSSVELVYGDCSPRAVLNDGCLWEVSSESYALRQIRYRVFRRNLGSALGHNLLGRRATSDYILVMNPDVLLAPDALIELMKPFADPGVGMTEARQLPIEHPKAFDPTTGATSWATTACAMTPTRVLKELGGFDHKTFFLYCDDVDYSWRVRLQGMKVVFCNNAVVFHDKRLGHDGGWMPGKAEQYYSAEAALMMAHKYSRPDIVADILRTYVGSGVDFLEKAAATYQRRKDAGLVPTPIDPGHRVAEFIGNGQYGRHRYEL